MELINLVATAKVAPLFDLKELAEKLEDSELRTNWLKMRLKPENYYIAFYKSGKFLITGIKSIEEVDEIADRVITILNNAGISTDEKQIKIHNLVFMEVLHLDVNLETLYSALNLSKVSYEPEQFPGLVYKDSKGTILMFSSGKLIITGVNTQKEAEDIVKNFKREVKYGK